MGRGPAWGVLPKDHARRIAEDKKLFTSREWQLAVSNESWWVDKTSKMWSNMQCCAFCGQCAFERFEIPVHDAAFPPPQQYRSGRQLPGSVSPAAEEMPAPYSAQCAAVADACTFQARGKKK